MPAGKQPSRWRRGAPILASRLQQLADGIVQRMVGGPRIRVSRVGTRVVIQADDQGRGPDTFLASVTGWALVPGANTRWRYAWAEVRLQNGEVSVKSGGRSGTTTSGYALNLTELTNVTQGAGTQGNSVDDSGAAYPSNFSIQPVGGGTGGVTGCNVVVRMSAVRDHGTGGKQYVFEYQNADDGTCG